MFSLNRALCKEKYTERTDNLDNIFGEEGLVVVVFLHKFTAFSTIGTCRFC